jgi:hypothetical protein
MRLNSDVTVTETFILGYPRIITNKTDEIAEHYYQNSSVDLEMCGHI